VRWYDRTILSLVLYSVAMLFLEVATGGEHSTGFFLWSERVVAVVLSVELLLRCIDHASPENGGDRDYFKSPEIVFDVIAVAPFWIGFFVPEEYLSAVRSLRILRLLKFYQASPVAHLVMENLLSQGRKLGVIGSFVGTMALFSAFTVHHLERATQPETFGSLWSSLWWTVVTVTTVGYGDMTPKTHLGQAVAMMLMVVGVSFIGALFSVVAGAFTHANVDAAVADPERAWDHTKGEFRQYERKSA
jgi:voltage-gated potassium channel